MITLSATKDMRLWHIVKEDKVTLCGKDTIDFKTDKEMGKGRNSMSFYRDIIALRRPVDDLEILCRVCNAKHYLESKYGKLPIAVMWRG